MLAGSVRKPFYLAAALTLAMLLILGAISVSQVFAQKKEITVGFGMSLTGRYAPGAVGEMQAYQLWAEDVNKRGGIFVKELGKRLPVRLVYYDDRSITADTVRIYEKLITSDKVDLLLGPYGSVGHFAVVPVSEKYKAPIVGSTAASVKIREMGARYLWFPTSAIPDRQMQALVDLLKANRDKIRNVAVIYLQELFPLENLRFLIPALKKAKIPIILQKNYPAGVTDLTTLLREVKGKNPDAVIALTYPADAFVVTSQAKEVGLNPKFFFELVGPAVVVFGPKFGKATEGITTMGHWSPKGKWPGAKEFYDRYKARWKREPDFLNSVLGYVAGQILEQAVEKAGSLNWAKIRQAIVKSEFSTINGPVRFKGPENISTPSMILQWQKGMLEIVWPPRSATAKPLIPKPAWP